MIQQEGLGPLLRNGLYKASMCVWEEDFHADYDFTDLTGGINWTAAGVGALVPAAADVLDGAFGELQVNAAGTADDGYVSGLSNSEWVVAADGKRILFKCRVKMAEATQSDFHIGLMDTAATDIIGTGIQDGMYFRKDDGDANWDFVLEKATVATANTAIHTAVADTYVELAFEWLSIDASVGSGKLWVYVDGKPVDGLNGKYYATQAPVELMGFGLVAQNGSAANADVTLDYVGIAVER